MGAGQYTMKTLLKDKPITPADFARRMRGIKDCGLTKGE